MHRRKIPFSTKHKPRFFFAPNRPHIIAPIEKNIYHNYRELCPLCSRSLKYSAAGGQDEWERERTKKSFTFNSANIKDIALIQKALLFPLTWWATRPPARPPTTHPLATVTSPFMKPAHFSVHTSSVRARGAATSAWPQRHIVPRQRPVTNSSSDNDGGGGGAGGPKKEKI